MRIKGKSYIAEFDKEINNFSSIKNSVTGMDYIKSAPQVPLLSLTGLNKEAEKITLIPEEAMIKSEENTIVVQYNRFSGFSIFAELTITGQEEKMVISADIQNNETGVDIVEVLCPHISGVLFGDETRDSYLIYPHHAGEKILNPVQEFAGEKMQNYGRSGTKLAGNVYAREINYCGLASMSWMYYYDDKNGLYIGSHDERFPVTGVIAEAGNDKPYMGLNFRKHHRISYGQTYKTGDYVIAITEKDWHYGAQIYRSYIEPYLDFDHTPEFLKNECSLNQCYNFKRRGTIENYFRDIPDMYEAGKAWGIRHMFIASWNRTGFDSFYPEYYPDMELGSAMEFRRGLEYVKKHDGFSTLYINARIFDKKSDFHKTLGEKMAIRQYDGSMIGETYGPEHFTVNCPSDSLWRDYLIDTAEFAVKAYGADGIYLDQLASAEPFPCYNSEHSHDNIGDFNNGYVYVLKELFHRLKEYNPDAYLMTENCGDIYGSYVWGNLTWNGEHYDEFFNVFKYTFPEFVQVNMVNPRGWVQDMEEKRNWFYKDMQRAILLGSVLWMGITTHLKEETEFVEFSKKALNFREKIQPYINGATFLDNKYISEITDGCDATSWRLADGRVMILCGNKEKVDTAVVKLNLDETSLELQVFNTNWEQTVERNETGNVVYPIGNERLWCFIIGFSK
ncbi:MAG TPA: hypothetical protein GXX75_24710 [Clostridiales bacterium]|nr:hypothetical protein [Clostridiales bacterium]